MVQATQHNVQHSACAHLVLPGRRQVWDHANVAVCAALSEAHEVEVACTHHICTSTVKKQRHDRHNLASHEQVR